MKKGCILKTIFFLTIFVAVVLYIIQQKFGDLIDSPETEFILPFINNNITEKLKFIKDSPQKIDFEKMVEDVKSGIEYIKELPSDQINKISETFDDIFSDSIITENELNYMRDLIKKIKK
ncbi:MAG: hypothetical protein IIA48_03855 [Bacteroidetes bacterium]|nr:hypothetical protein [Bacteroidota bacterium]MCH8941560.1 hypothetical protein [Bacteroidota bacterium]